MPPPRDTWNPTQYDRFQEERSRPFFDLLAMVRPREGMRVVDLGCGTGQLTATMHDRLRAKSTLGVDSSDAMLEKCRAHANNGLSFAKGDLAELARSWSSSPAGERFDLIVSNAAIHWVSDHETLLSRLGGCLQPGGQLAVQVPANDDHPAHTTARAIAAEPPFAQALGGFTHRPPVHPPERYATWLYRMGYEEQDVRVTVYAHVLESRESVLEWVKGTLLTDYERRLGPLFGSFLERYRARLLESLADDRPFFYPFKRLLFWGRRP